MQSAANLQSATALQLGARKALPAQGPAQRFTAQFAQISKQRTTSQRFVTLAAAGNGASPTTSNGAAFNGTSSKPETAPMNVVFVSAEVAPWSKTGGLGDVAGALPIELAKRGHHVISIAPRYDQYWDAWDTGICVNVEGEDIRFFHSVKKGVHRVWVDHPWFLAKVWGQTGSKLYGSKSGADYIDNQKRFKLFCHAALQAIKTLPFGPGEDCLVVANDWHSCLVPVLLKDVYQPRGEFKNTKVALCMHNIAFQGRFLRESWNELGLPASSLRKFEFEDGYPKVFDEASPADDKAAQAATAKRYPKINWLRAGILSADKVLTVSPNYATEIASGPALGVELDNVVRMRGVEGIVNGMDVEEWSPALDKFLQFKYNADTVEAGKAYAKAQLQKEAGLPVDPRAPLFGFIGRLEEQKGVDILLAALGKIPKASNAQIVILGTGKKSLEASVKNLKQAFPSKAAGIVKFSNPMAHLITAGCDFMLVPSRFEPCGLIQLHAMQYGTVPLVASTGGLVDTVKEGVTGFHMGAFDPDTLLESDAEAVATTIGRASQVFTTPAFKEMRSKCIRQDLSWVKPAKKWEAVLIEMKYGPNATPEASADKAAIRTPVQKV